MPSVLYLIIIFIVRTILALFVGSSSVHSVFRRSEKTSWPILVVAVAILHASLQTLAVAGQGGDESQPKPRNSLYDPNDQILEIVSRTHFEQAIFNKSKSFFIEYYSSWCGHCMQFAPTYKRFAKRVAAWSDTVQVSAVNCATDENFNLCREHDIQLYPTMKYYKYWSTNVNDSTVYLEGRDDEHALASALARLTFEDATLSSPPNWPNFRFVDSQTGVTDIWRQIAAAPEYLSVRDTVQYVVLIAVDNGSIPIAAEVVLDFVEFRSRMAIRLIKHDSRLAGRLFSSLTDAAKQTPLWPGLVIFKKGTEIPYYVSELALSSQDIQAKILYHTDTNMLHIENASTTFSYLAPDDKFKPEPTFKAKFFVHKLDLLSSLWYIFYREVGKYKTLHGAKLEALKEFMEILLKYFPADDKERQFLFKLTSWINSQPNKMSVDVWLKQLDTFQEQTGQPLPLGENFVVCRGSKPKTRRYPCSLWTLFHTITVRAYEIDGSLLSSFVPRTVILSFRNFVTEIFGCAQCATNFDGETAGLERDVVKPRDVVLYLWKVHNRVNKRLKGSASEDPVYPKEQFPMPQLCPTCFNQDSQEWNEDKVLQFLLDYYSDIKTDHPSKFGLPPRVDYEPPPQQRPVNPKFQRQNHPLSSDATRGANTFFNSVDISLCLGLWLLSTFIHGGGGLLW